MKRYAIYLFVAAIALAPTKTVDAADKHKAHQGPKPQAAPTEIKGDGKMIGPDRKGKLAPAIVQNKVVDGKTRIVIPVSTPCPQPGGPIPIPDPNAP